MTTVPEAAVAAAAPEEERSDLGGSSAIGVAGAEAGVPPGGGADWPLGVVDFGVVSLLDALDAALLALGVAFVVDSADFCDLLDATDPLLLEC